MLILAFGTRSKEQLVDYHGWVIRYDAKTFAQQGAWCATVNKVGPSGDTAGEGAGVWMSGSGLAGDDDGNVYLITGNARADETVKSYGNGIIKLRPTATSSRSPGGSRPTTRTGSSRSTTSTWARAERSSSPGPTSSSAVARPGSSTTSTARRWRCGRRSWRSSDQYDPTFDVLSDWEGGPHLHETPLFWRGSDPEWGFVYDWSEQDYLKAYKVSMTTQQFDTKPIVGSVLALEGIMPGGMISLSANGNQPGTAIVWALLPASTTEDPYFGAYPARFLAFDGETLELLWETTADTMPKWMPPTVADGRVLVPTTSKKVVIYELDQ